MQRTQLLVSKANKFEKERNFYRIALSRPFGPDFSNARNKNQNDIHQWNFTKNKQRLRTSLKEPSLWRFKDKSWKMESNKELLLFVTFLSSFMIFQMQTPVSKFWRWKWYFSVWTANYEDDTPNPASTFRERISIFQRNQK